MYPDVRACQLTLFSPESGGTKLRLKTTNNCTVSPENEIDNMEEGWGVLCGSEGGGEREGQRARERERKNKTRVTA